MKQLEKGKLYEVWGVKHGEWVVAEYTSAVPAHTAHGYQSMTGKKEWHEPDAHFFRGITIGACHIRDRNLQVRPCSDELLAEIARVQAKIADLKQQNQAAWKELRSICE